MFYLNHFFKSLKNFKISGFLFILLTITLTTALHNRDQVKHLFSLANKTISKPYFNALISSNVDLSIVARKLRKLPGVEAVRIKKAIDVSNELGSLKGELEDDLLESLSSINYSSLTVELGNSLQARSQSLIREYLGRLVGKNSVTISDIKKPEAIKIKSNDPYLLLNNWGDFYIIGLLSVLWIASCFSFAKYLKNYSYLIEKFQRKKNVGMKIFMVGLLSVTLFTFIANLYIRPTLASGEWLYLIVLFSFSLLIFGRKIEYKKLL